MGIALMVSLLLPRLAVGGDSKPTEYEVEAAYLSNFGRFAEWPVKPSPGEPFHVCVWGQDPFGALLDNAVKGEAIGAAPIAIKRISGLEDVLACRILFITSSRESQLPGILTTLGGANVLTVSNIASFTRRGGMIQFVIDGNRIRFEINLAAARRAGLTLSSQLLKLAVAVRGSQ
ncbi:MAG: YfiR family protein [Acidobacteriota bacterium]|nr:YfiR family protein [Acidobacteriota bacterium]